MGKAKADHTPEQPPLDDDARWLLIKAAHDTSVVQIERTYSKHITDPSDDISRAALLQHEPPPAPVASNVVPLSGR